jgi:hypothetical protein
MLTKADDNDISFDVLFFYSHGFSDIPADGMNTNASQNFSPNL